MTRATDRMIQLLEDIRDNTESTSGTSSIEIEDLASKPEPKITTKVYVGTPLTQDDIDRCLQAHAYAKRRAKDMALNGWQETIDLLKANVATQAAVQKAAAEYEPEELPEFEPMQP